MPERNKRRGAKSKPPRKAPAKRAGVKGVRRPAAPYARVQRNEGLASDVDKVIKAAGGLRREIEAKIERELEALRKPQKRKKR